MGGFFILLCCYLVESDSELYILAVMRDLMSWNIFFNELGCGEF